jgi:hypothetical protein
MTANQIKIMTPIVMGLVGLFALLGILYAQEVKAAQGAPVPFVGFMLELVGAIPDGAASQVAAVAASTCAGDQAFKSCTVESN